MVRSYTYGVARGMAMKFGSALTRLGGKRGDVMGMVRTTHISDVPGSRIHDPVVTPCVGAAQHPRVPHRLPRRSWSWHHRHHSQSNIQVAPLHVVQHAPPNFLVHLLTRVPNRAEEVARQFELSGAKFVVTLAMFLPNVKQVTL